MVSLIVLLNIYMPYYTKAATSVPIYKTDTIPISDYREGSTGTLPGSIPYNNNGYTGTLYPNGSPWVISGSAAGSKTVSDYRSSSSNDLPSTIWYNDGSYSGTLYGQGASSWVVSGSAADSKTVTGAWDSIGNWVNGGITDNLEKWDVWAWYPSNTPAPQGAWTYKGSFDQPQYNNFLAYGANGATLNTDYLWKYPLDKNYNDGTYSGSLHRYSNAATNTYYYPEPPHNGGWQLRWSYWNTWYYSGTVSRPDTRVWNYGQSYSGTVSNSDFSYGCI